MFKVYINKSTKKVELNYNTIFFYASLFEKGVNLNKEILSKGLYLNEIVHYNKRIKIIVYNFTKGFSDTVKRVVTVIHCQYKVILEWSQSVKY